jgi:hypothetical protein
MHRQAAPEIEVLYLLGKRLASPVGRFVLDPVQFY